MCASLKTRRPFNNNKIPWRRRRPKSNKMQAWEAVSVCRALYQTTRALAIKARALIFACVISLSRSQVCEDQVARIKICRRTNVIPVLLETAFAQDYPQRNRISRANAPLFARKFHPLVSAGARPV